MGSPPHSYPSVWTDGGRCCCLILDILRSLNKNGPCRHTYLKGLGELGYGLDTGSVSQGTVFEVLKGHASPVLVCLLPVDQEELSAPAPAPCLPACLLPCSSS